MRRFSGEQFALCGKTIVSLRRNVLHEILPKVTALGFHCEEKRSENLVVVRSGGRENRFYLFGGYDEGSAALIQGVTLAGVLFDEAALMPRSFVEQASARCSVSGSKLWFNCNPEGPMHWFYREWILRAEERGALYLHFTMDDNPSLSPRIRARYEKAYSGTFYRRFILGEWTAAKGLIYDFFTPQEYCARVPEKPWERVRISIDYGTVNPTSFGLWALKDGVWYRAREYYFDSRREGRQKTDTEYVADLKKFAAGETVEKVIVDPSAASFIEALRREGFPVSRADNDVADGIRVTANLLKQRKIVICEGCESCLSEIAAYCWEESGTGRDRPKKERDHAMDEMRYFAVSIAKKRNAEAALRCARWSARRDEQNGKGEDRMKVPWQKERSTGGETAVQLRSGGRSTFGRLESYVPLLDGGDSALPRGARGGAGGGRGHLQADPADGRRARGMRQRAGGAGLAALFVRGAGGQRAERHQRLFGLLPRFAFDLRARGGRDRTGRGRTRDRGGAVRGRFAGGGARGDNPLEFCLCGVDGGGRSVPLEYQDLLLFTPLNPEAGHPYGVSMLRSMPYLTGLLLKIYDAMGKNWDRCGNVRFAVTYKPQDGELDRGAAQERAEQIAEEWSRAMQEGRNGSVRDFVSVGDVSIKAIGADNQILDSETPVRQILEQLVAKTGLPPFMLGLSWSSTERMSAQQADMLTSEITALRRTLEPVIERVCTLWLRMHGYGCRAVVDWEDINLQDEVEEAKAALYLQQARKLRQENDEAEGK